MITLSDQTDTLEQIISLGGEELTRVLSDSASESVSRVLTKVRPSKYDTNQPLTHEVYRGKRVEYIDAILLAELAQDGTRNELISEFSELQVFYAKQVSSKLASHVEQARDVVDLFASEKEANDEIRREFEKLKSMSGDQLLEGGNIEKIQQLRTKIEEIKDVEKDIDANKTIVEGADRAIATLETLQENPTASIHYIVPSFDDLTKKLNSNEFNGPEFAPLTLSKVTVPTDIYNRASLATLTGPATSDSDEICMDDLHPLFRDMLLVYRSILATDLGSEVDPKQIHNRLEEPYVGVKGIGSLLERHQTSLGIEKVERTGSRLFVRLTTGQTLSESKVISIIANGDLQPVDRKAVNDFYFNKAFEHMREEPRGYVSFTKEDLFELIEGHKLPVTKMYVSKNFKPEKIGLRSLGPNDRGDTRYTFIDVVPTSRQIEAVKQGVLSFGINRFSAEDLTSRLGDRNFPTHRRVVEHILDQSYEGLSLEIAGNDPVTYRRSASQNETTEHEESTTTADTLM